ncbi:MAG: GGDEF domain-containing protein [Desulfovibrio sp.]|nr:GGDEF domain-containing protein [Desulfovibrio sp.]MBQ1846317.1 GGDEF domain-containing protein [Desulfovibrio sp.]MBQ4125287.1 GGDEF domain-containing protein [Desulfovibrio sp.]
MFTKRKETKNPRLHTLNIPMLLVSSIVLAFLVYVTYVSLTNFTEMQDVTERYITAQQDASSMLAASDYLTAQTLIFAVNTDKSLVEKYFHEAFKSKRRERSVESMERLFPNNRAFAKLKSALAHSNELMQREFHAMRLIIEARKYPIDSFPQELRDFNLTPEELALQPVEQQRLAQQLVFGSDYQMYKDWIRDDISECLSLLQEETKEQMLKTPALMRNLIRYQYILIIVLVIVMLVFIASTSLLVIKPLKQGADSMRKQQTMPEVGVYELQSFAKTYNDLFLQNQDLKSKLAYKAEHDALTGLLNRGAFERMRLQNEKRKTALILVDVDKFKEINDTHGHDVGDKVLQKVARFLLQSFRAEDHVFRLGGDEFAIIMVYADSSMRDIVEQKMLQCNEQLSTPKDGLPVATLSVGVAFSDRKDPSGDIFKDADLALYSVKRRGRNGIAFYSDAPTQE